MPEKLFNNDKLSNTFLTVQDLAHLLHVNEKKIYQLAGDGDLPGTKITGKWIFPRTLIEDWINENSHCGVMNDRLIMVGSDDHLISQVCNSIALEYQQSALFSYCPSGTRHGLHMLDTQKADACFINWGASESHARRHLGLLRGYKNHSSWVMVRCLQRNQGLILSPQLAQETLDIEKLLGNPALRWAYRNNDSGTERLLDDACSQHHVKIRALQTPELTHTHTLTNTERSAVAAVSTGVADITCGSESTAHEYRLPFLPLAQINIDMVMSRRTYFRALLQTFLNRLTDESTQDVAKGLKGYRVFSRLDVLTVA